jgi:hypothetical protein
LAHFDRSLRRRKTSGVEGEAEVDVVRTKRRDWPLAAARQDAAAAIRGSGNFVADDFRIWQQEQDRTV